MIHRGNISPQKVNTADFCVLIVTENCCLKPENGWLIVGLRKPDGICKPVTNRSWLITQTAIQPSSLTAMQAIQTAIQAMQTDLQDDQPHGMSALAVDNVHALQQVWNAIGVNRG